MENKQKSNKITIANLVSLVGLALLFVFSFLGHSYMSGGELGWDVLISVGITAVSALLLWFLVKAKGAVNSLNLWKKIEFSVLAFYILVAIPFTLFGGIMQFFVVNDNKEEIKLFAKEDLDKIDHLISEYREFEGQAISVTGTGLRNVTRKNQRADNSLASFMEENRIERDTVSTNNFERIQRSNLIGASFESYCNDVEMKRNEILNVVNSWSIMNIPSKSREIDDLAESVEIELTEKSSQAKLPKIEYVNGKYSITEPNQCRTFSLDGGVDAFKFKEALQQTSGFSITALLVVLVIHFLILFNYIFAYRSISLDIKDNPEDDGGQLL